MEEEMKRIFLTILIVLVSVSLGFAANLKVSELTETQTLTDDDLFMVSTYLTGAYTSKYIKKNYLVTSLGITNNAATMTVIDTTDASAYVALFDSATGNLAIKTDTKITFDATTGVLTATGFAGPITGAVTGTASGNIPNTLADAAGDIIQGSADNTWARLAIGTAYQIPHVNSGATALAYTSTLGATGTRFTTGYFTNLEITNLPTINGAAITTLLQPLDGELTALAGLTSAANAIPYFTGSGTAGVISSSADIVGFLGSADAATALANIGGQVSDSALTTLSSKTFSKTALTGTGGLDTVLYADLADGDIGMVGTIAGIIYWYVFEDSSSTAESSPSVIAPDDVGANTGRWLLKLYCDGSSCTVPQAATGAASRFLEGSANGTDYMQLKADDDVGTNRKIVLSSSVSNSEDLSIQLGANDNTVTIASSTGVTSIGFGAIGLATTGTISGGSLTPVIGDADDFDNNFTGANLYGGTYIVNAAGSIILANSAVGVNFTVLLEDAVATIIEPLATGTDDTIVLNGTALTQGASIQSSTKGAMCVFQYRAADSWMATCNGFIVTP
jgi:hypothetical protein